jgi:sodium transport system ATP-binding protein
MVGDEVLVRAVSLEKRFASTYAVRGVTLDVRAGEIVGLLGPNGAGKTTTLRMLSAVLTPTAGTAFVAGHSVDGNPQAVRRAIGFLTGGTALYVRLTPREILRYFGRLYDRPRDEIESRSAELIRDLAMATFADRPCGTLSTGQRQRANIARALIHDPPVLVFDEPTLGLDIAGARFILDFLRDARARGKAILFSSHTIGDIEALCDRIAVLCAGRIAALAPHAEILAQSGLPTLAEAFLAIVDSVDREDSALRPSPELN